MKDLGDYTKEEARELDLKAKKRWIREAKKVRELEIKEINFAGDVRQIQGRIELKKLMKKDTHFRKQANEEVK